MRLLPPVAVLVAAVLLFFLPGYVDDHRDDAGIAWTAPKGERVVFAEAGLAVTERDEGFTFTGRDIDTGARRWRREFPPVDSPRGQGQVTRIGKTLLVDARDSRIRALDLATGLTRWETPQAGTYTHPAVATPEIVAMSVCDENLHCHAEARSVSDGRLRWQTPMAAAGPWLGSPPIAQAVDVDRSLWPASAVIVRTRVKEDPRYEVRQLATGKVVARGAPRNQAVGVVGNLFLRQTEDGTLTAIDVTTGNEVWTRAPNQGLAARAPDDSLDWLAIPDGSLLLTSELRDVDDLKIGDELRVLDPRTGKLTIRQTHIPGSNTTVVVPADGPPITAANATAGPVPRVPVIEDWVNHHVIADGRLYEVPLHRRDTAATATQVGWHDFVPRVAGKERPGVVVYDRRSGKRTVRRAGHGDRDLYLHSEGERLVIYDDGRDSVVKP